MKVWILSIIILLSLLLLDYYSQTKIDNSNPKISQTQSSTLKDSISKTESTAKENQNLKYQSEEINVFPNFAVVGLLLIAGFGIALYIRFREKGKLLRKITEQKREVEQLNKILEETNQQMAELVSTRDRFFSIIAHDLKSPFNSILGFSEIIVDEADILNKEELTEYAGSIRDSAKNTLMLLQNLLDWSRAQTGKLQIEKTNFRLLEAIDENIRLHKLAAEKKEIQLINNIGKEIVVYADYSMITAVVRNLINNAIKFTSKGKVMIESELLNGYVKVSILDTGVGIAEENIKKLFKADALHSTQGTEHEHGTGLGLILCKEFVERNEGILKVESQPGKGSKFSFTVYKEKPVSEEFSTEGNLF